MKTYRFWTTAEEKRLEELRTSGMIVRLIAIEMNRTQSSILNKLSEREVISGFFNRRQRWMELLIDNNIPLKQVAKMMGVKVGTVKHQKWRLRQAGFNVPVMQGGAKKRAA